MSGMPIRQCSVAMLFCCVSFAQTAAAPAQTAAAPAQTAAAPAQTATAPAARPPATEVAGIHVNYDEALVGTYTLPNPLVTANGKPVKSAKDWTEKRRTEIVRLFEENEYGRAPGRPAGMSFDV